uniref:Ubiquitin associated/TS-N domain-containing protein n=1 Tax=Solanum tuberosum TaxID=4113 RepID=M1APK8_SOLTU
MAKEEDEGKEMRKKDGGRRAVRPSGFNNAPVTRALVIACTIFTIIFGVRGRGNQLGWSYQKKWQKKKMKEKK